ncbi:hypothetical protein ACWHY4_17495 [Pseudomonas sp. E2-15]|uniref:hypothetical protein n=1 Tax=Pseudomonas sp. D47 TaxID=3159447 RepID=UPI00387B3D45
MNVANRKIITDFETAILARNYTDRFAPATFLGEVPNFTGLLYRETALGDTITVTIPLGTGVLAGNTLTFEVVPFDVTVPFALPTPDVEATDSPYFLTAKTYLAFRFLADPIGDTVVSLPRSLFSSGVHLLRYGIGDDDPTVGNRTMSVPQLIIIDGVSPYDLPRIAPPAPVPPQPLPVPFDRNYFASQPGRRVMFTLPYDAARGRQEGDYAQFRFGELPYPIPIDSTSAETKYPISNDPAVAVTVPLSLDTIEAAPNGNFRFSYQLCDVANYCSEWSNVYLLNDVAMGPAATDFLAPQVLHAVPGDNLINRADMALEGGLQVLIPPYTNPQRSTPTDTFRVTLTPTATPGSTGVAVTLADRPLGNTPFSVPVLATPAQLATLYGNAVGTQQVTVSYVVIRGGVTYPVAATTIFNLDLNVIVIPGTTDGTDANPNLPPVVVQPVRPAGETRPNNRLERVDNGRDAVGLVTLWNVATLPAAATPFVISFSYGAYSAEKTFSTPADIPANGIVEFPITWDTIRALGGPLQIASYTVRRTTSTNQQQPLNATEVTVESVFRRMNAPIVRRATTTVVCSTLDPLNTGILRVFIPPSVNLDGATNGSITITGYRNTSQAAPVAASTTIPFPNPLPLSASTLGFDLTFPSPGAFFKQIQNARSVNAASLRLIYSVTVAGELVNSDPADYRLNHIRPGPITSALYCDGTPVPVV